MIPFLIFVSILVIWIQNHGALHYMGLETIWSLNLLIKLTFFKVKLVVFMIQI
jgi:hypothetical protein